MKVNRDKKDYKSLHYQIDKIDRTTYITFVIYWKKREFKLKKNYLSPSKMLFEIVIGN